MKKLLINRKKPDIMKPYVSSMAYVPLSHLTAGQLSSLKEELTVTVSEPSSVRGDPTFITKTVKNYTLNVKGFIGLPRHFGIERFSGLKFLDLTEEGDKVPKAYQGIKPITPRNDQQRDYFRSISTILQSQEFTDYIAVAKTGSGKTAATINAAIMTGKPQLIVVHTNRLKEGWLGSQYLKNGLRFFCGDEFVDNYVGVIQQDRCDFRNKLIGIALVHSLAVRKYPLEFYLHWHGVHFDELHKHIAPHFAKVPMLFPQKVRGGMTATLRDDALGKIAHWHFGPTRVTSEQKILKPDVYICTFKAEVPQNKFNRYSDHTELTALTQIAKRNELIAKIAYHRGYLRKRNLIIIGDRVHQLQEIYKLLRGMGVKWSALGMYTGKVYTGKIKVRVKVRDVKKSFLLEFDGDDKFPSRKLARSFYKDWAKENPIPHKVSFEEDYYEVPDSYYRRMEKRCSIFMTTYGIFEAGNDIPKLDMGIEASPRTDQRQPLGRILREFEGKPTPEWYSLSDEITYKTDMEEILLEDYLSRTVRRIESFKQQDAKIIRVNLQKKFTK